MAKKAPKGLLGSAGGKKKKKAFGGKKPSDEATNGGSSGGGGLGVSKGSPAFSAPRTSVRATTHKGRRVLAARESQLVEDLKSTLLLFGKRTSQLVKVSKERERIWKRWRRPFVSFFFVNGGSSPFLFLSTSKKKPLFFFFFSSKL